MFSVRLWGPVRQPQRQDERPSHRERRHHVRSEPTEDLVAVRER